MLYYIYKITCKNESSDYLYIGSTKDFRPRLNKHKSDCYNENSRGYNCKLYQVIRANGGWQNWAIEIIAEVDVESKDDAEIIEEEYRVKLNGNLNSQRCFRTHEERLEYDRIRYENNREKLLEYNRNWYEEHKEKLSIKCDCDCGGKYTMTNKVRHLKTNKHQNYLKTLN